jgi:signal-transduction protein with cAMP-binding, CBS, and nucleotidyltransferase domain|uniref:CBS domain-containing protein n=1 Tax=viral metagenome TaxID=1070528 RepID=A0A6C0JM13_9ZZZZ
MGFLKCQTEIIIIINKYKKKFLYIITSMLTSRFLQKSRCFSTLKMPVSALNVFQNSCYHKIDFKINEDKSAKEAVTRFTAFNVGCLAVTDSTDKVVGVCSERDFITKVASLGKDYEVMKVKDICTYGPKIIIAKKEDSLETCMSKMMFKDIRHLLVIDEKNEEFIGMISIKDLIKEIMKEKNETITRLSDFSLGKGAFFGSE